MEFYHILIVCLSLAFSVAAVDEDESITFSARNLPIMDPFNGKPDAYINVYYKADSNSKYTLLGKTEYINNDHNPDWPEVFLVPNNGDHSQMLNIDMYDADWPDSDDYMGHVEIPLYDLIQSREGVLNKELIGGNPGGGSLIITRNQS